MSVMDSVATGSVIALVLLLCGLLLLAFRHPIMAKWGVRNITRRPLQSVLIIVGLTLSTVIFAAALSLGDSLNHSIRRQVVEAYGHIDQVIVPPYLLSLVEEASDGDVELGAAEEDSDIVALLTGLAEGDVDSLQSLAVDGLPGITQQSYQTLQSQLADEPLVDGVAEAIFFPTIIRNLHTGQGEPLGLIFAVDQAYEAEFGLHDIYDRPVRMADLQPGIGNVFPFVVGNTISLYAQLLEFVQAVTAASDGTQPTNTEVATGVLVALGALLLEMQGETFTLNDLRLDLATLEEMGVDTSFFQENDIPELSLQALGITADDPVWDALGLTPDATIRVPSLGDLGLELPDTTNVFSQFNLATLGQDTDRLLNQAGMQLHQGDVYLSELGAQLLDAQVGDSLEIFVGPLPVSYRVRAIVKEAGPLGVLIPVVMMDIAEAQQLLFMSERINAILISNEGDELSGIQHTDTVNQRLRGYALNEQHFVQLQTLLRSPDVASVIRAEAATAQHPFMDPDMPVFLVPLVDDMVGSGNFASDIEVLARYVADPAPDLQDDAPADLLPLKVALGNPGVRDWLKELPLAASDARDLDKSLQAIDEFLVLAPLSKRLALTGAEIAGVSFGTLFSISGTLSVLAGMILIFLIFVMLAAERRRELGVMRAVGLRRGHLVHMFVTEGLVYDLAAALIGLGLGLLAAFGMIGFVNGFFRDIIDQQFGARSALFAVQWAVLPSSIVIAYSLGVLLTWMVVTLSAWRVSRMNIVAAIRDLPNVARLKTQSHWPEIAQWGAGLGLLAGGLYLVVEYQTTEQTLLLIGTTLILLGMAVWGNRALAYSPIPALRRQQIVHIIVGAGLIGIWAFPWQETTQEVMEEQQPFLLLLSFVLSSPIILTGAILVIMGSADFLAQAALRLGGLIGSIAPAMRIAIAYPLHQRFRTGVAMMLFAMVILTVVVMTYVIRATEILANPSLERTAGFDLILTPGLLSVFDPVFDLGTELQAIPEFPLETVALTSSIARLDVQYTSSTSDQQSFRSEEFVDVLGVDAGYTTQASQVYGFARRAAGYDTDTAVWEALTERNDVAVVSNLYRFVEDISVADTEEVLPELFLELESVASGSRRTTTVQVIGVLADGEMLAYDTVQVNRRVLEFLRGQPIAPDNHYVKVVEGADVNDTARALEKGLLSNSMNVMRFADQFVAGQAIIRSVLQVFRGFAALGLIVGLAGLAVISSRSVVERRQQVGMLRAIGYHPSTIGLIFVLEASFIALTGICIGVAAGMVMGDKMIVQFYEMATELTFPVPWLSIGITVLLTYAFALLAALLPAWQASRVFPAEALRYD